MFSNIIASLSLVVIRHGYQIHMIFLFVILDAFPMLLVYDLRFSATTSDHLVKICSFKLKIVIYFFKNRLYGKMLMFLCSIFSPLDFEL